MDLPRFDRVSPNCIFPLMSWSMAFMSASLCVSCTSSPPVNASFFWNACCSPFKSSKSSVCCFTYRSAAIIKPNVPQAGSLHSSPGCGSINSVITSIKTLGVKYCPAPDFFSFAFFSKSPSYRLPRPSSFALYQSRASMLVIIFFRFAGSSILERAPA